MSASRVGVFCLMCVLQSVLSKSILLLCVPWNDDGCFGGWVCVGVTIIVILMDGKCLHVSIY